MDYLVYLLILIVIGGTWGALMAILLPAPICLVAAFAGGLVIGYLGNRFYAPY